MSITEDLIVKLKAAERVTELAPKILESVIRGLPVEGETPASLYVLFQEMLTKKYSAHRARELLTDIGVSRETAEELAANWADLPPVRSGVVFPQLVDVNWSTGHIVSTSSIKGVHLPNIEIALYLQEDNEITPTRFTCSREQLSELVFKLKSAVTQVEKLTN